MCCASRGATGDAAQLGEFAEWCVRQGVSNLLAPVEWRPHWHELLLSLSARPLFVHDDLPSGIVQNQPTAIFLFGSLRDRWFHMSTRLEELPAQTMLVLPEDLRQPDRPDRLVRDVLVRPPRV